MRFDSGIYEDPYPEITNMWIRVYLSFAAKDWNIAKDEISLKFITDATIKRFGIHRLTYPDSNLESEVKAFMEDKSTWQV